MSWTGSACPDVRTILTYSLSDNPRSPFFADQTKMFSKKQWVTERFCMQRRAGAHPVDHDPGRAVRRTRTVRPKAPHRRRPSVAGAVHRLNAGASGRGSPGPTDAGRSPAPIKSVGAAMSFYITTPIYYVNAQPHLGHAYTTIACDVLARHMRQRGEDVFFLTGTDEHGEPVADAAHAQGLEPLELANRNAERFKALMPRLGASNDFFIRTTDEEHMRRVQEVLQRVYDNGHVYKGVYEGWYCPRCADFKVENEILEGNRCPIHEIQLTRESEENYFFRLSAFQDAARAALRGAARLRDARGTTTTRRARSSPRGLQDVSLSRGAPEVGGDRALGSEPRVLRVVRRAPELLHRARLRAPRRGPDRALLAGDVPRDRQGHPQVPHGVLAGDADGGGSPAAGARIRAWLPARRGRAQDEQVARQRARSRSR